MFKRQTLTFHFST